MYILYIRVYEILTYTLCVRCYQWHVLAVAVLCAREQLPNV